MNSKERVIATLNREPTDRTAIDCWLYQKQFVERLAEDYGSREEFMDEFNIDIIVGFVPYPNQFGRMFDVSELADVDLGNPLGEKAGSRPPFPQPSPNQILDVPYQAEYRFPWRIDHAIHGSLPPEAVGRTAISCPNRT